MSEVCKIRQGLQIAISERLDEAGSNRLPYITIQSINNPNQQTQYVENPTKNVICGEDDILMTRTGNTGIVVTNQSGVFHNNFFLINYDKEQTNRMFLFEYLRTPRIQHTILARAGTSTIPDLNHSDFYSLYLKVPPLPEQEKIAEVLGTWDRAVETQQNLIDSLTRRKKALMQQLLTGKTRLPGFEDEWKTSELSDLFSRVSKKNTDGHTQVVTISAQKGLICQQDYFNKQVASKVLDNYFVLGKGQFAYNKSYSKGYPMGAIKRLNRYDHGVVTTLYVCFALKSENESFSDFWEHYFESGALNRGLTRVAHEGGRAHGLLNVTPKDFFELKLPVPSFEEQQAIAKVLSAANQEIELHTQHLNSLRTQKRGLMQQLLTGKTRVTL
jgi:type I restriction enzyme S subunit